MASHAELAQKIDLAEKAVAARLRDPSDPDVGERTALRDALRALRVLIAEVDNYSKVGPPADPRKDIR